MQTSHIFIRECRVLLSIGLNSDEHTRTQPVLISVKADYSPDTTFPDIAEKSRARIIDYSLIYDFITQVLPSLGHIFLLEAAAEQIIAFCFRDPHICVAHVRIEKTAIFADAAGAGVDVTRTREGISS